MEKETNSTVDFLNNIDGVEETKKDIFKEDVLSETKEPEVEEEVKEKRLPFNKDPKVQRYIDEEIEKRLKFIPSAEQSFKQEVRDELNLPPALVKLVGNDTPEKREALKELSEYMEALPKRAQAEFEQKMLEDQQRVAEEDNAALNELNAGFEDIEDTYGVDISGNSAQAQKTRTSFVEYLRKVSHKNEDGEVDQFADIPAAWEEFQERNKPQSASRAKELASRSTRSTEAVSAPQTGNSWKDVDKYFDQLKRNN